MDQEVQNSQMSEDRMSIEEFPSRNSCFTKYKGEHTSLIALSNHSEIIIEDSYHQDLLLQLSSSDNGKLQQKIQSAIQSSQTRNQLEFLGRSHKGLDKNKLGQMNLQISVNYEEFLTVQGINHLCDCMNNKKEDICTNYCTCYNLPEKCSLKKCCPKCFQQKERRISEIRLKLQQQLKHNKSARSSTGLNTRKNPELDIGIYIDGNKRPQKKFRQQKCQCRNSRCENKYCVCFTAGNKCSVNCLCENCRNSNFIEQGHESGIGLSQTLRPYLQQGGEGNESLSEGMEFQPFQY